MSSAPDPMSWSWPAEASTVRHTAQRFEAQTAKDRGTRLRAWFSRDPAVATPLG